MTCDFLGYDTEATETQVASTAAASKEEKSQEGSQPDQPAEDNLNKLVSEAVKRVLQQQQQEILTGSAKSPTGITEAVVPECIVNQVVAELKPTISQRVPPPSAETSKFPHKAYLPPAGIPQYKPTPISELKKRHIPVPYTPLPAPRGISKVQVKRSSSNNNLKKLKSNAVIKDSQREQIDNHEAEEISLKKATYSPSPIAATSHNGWGASNKSVSYVPSIIDGNNKSNSDYVPSPLAPSSSIPVYCPSEKSISNIEPQYHPYDKSSAASGIEAKYVPGSSENTQTDEEYKPSGKSETDQISIEYKPTVKSELNEESNLAQKTNLPEFDIDFSHELDILEKILDENSEDSLNSKTEIENKKIESSTLQESELQRIHDTTSEQTTEESETKVRHKESSLHSKSHTLSSSSSSSSSLKKKDKEKKEKPESIKHSKQKDKHISKKREHKNSDSRNEHRKISRKDRTEKKSNDRHRSHRHRSSSDISEHSHRHSSSDADTVTKDKRSHSSSNHSSTKSRKTSRSSSGAREDRDRRKSSGAREDRDHRNHHKRSKHDHAVRSSKKESSRSSRKDLEERRSRKRVCEESEVEISEDGPEPEELTKFSMSDSEPDEEKINEECYRIFQEYKPDPKPPTAKKIKIEEPVKEKDKLLSRKRVAHEGAQYHPPQIAAPPKQAPNPVQVMYNRLANARALPDKKQKFSQDTSSSSSCENIVPTTTVTSSGLTSAGVPSSFGSSSSTAVPDLENNASIYAAMLKYVMTEEQLRDNGYPRPHPETKGMAVATVQSFYKKWKTLPERDVKDHRVCCRCGELYHIDQKGFQTQEEFCVYHWGRLHTVRDLENNASIYAAMLKYVMTEEQLRDNGYPRPHPETKGMAVATVQSFYKKWKTLPERDVKDHRVCCRCGELYHIDQKGFQTQEEFCVYHWGRLHTVREKGQIYQRYSCCQTNAELGCSLSNVHVHDFYNYQQMTGFVTTLPLDREPADGSYGVYALDCEMCYTTGGVELIRVTVVDVQLNTVYESMVKPQNPILDLNTR
ncbi:hypothetical protein C0J52_05651 [Blattella germanica]|nr:hypothetical protein C0J52_05651 [Blattella germanica]